MHPDWDLRAVSSCRKYGCRVEVLALLDFEARIDNRQLVEPVHQQTQELPPDRISMRP